MLFNVAVTALCCATSISALPGLRHSHKHQHQEAKRDAEPFYDTSKVDWNQALANVDWSKINYNLGTDNSNNKLAAGQQTVTVAVVGKTTVTPTSTSAFVAAAAAITTTLQLATAGTTTSSPPAAAGTSNAAAGLLQMVATNEQYSVKVVNNCPHTIWQAGWQTNTARALLDPQVKGNMMPAGSSITLAIHKKALGVQIWAREGCTGSGSTFTCAVGDCQGYQCTSIIWQGGPILAEFGAGLDTDMYNTDITAYDISAIPGNNVGVSILPDVSTCWKKICPKGGCAIDQAWQKDSDMHLGSPADTTCTNKANFVVTFCPASQWS